MRIYHMPYDIIILTFDGVEHQVRCKGSEPGSWKRFATFIEANNYVADMCEDIRRRTRADAMLSGE